VYWKASALRLEGPRAPLWDSDLIVGQLVPRLLAVGEDLPQHHAEAPHVTLCGEPPVHDALWRHPADRQHRMTAHLQGEGGREREGERERGKLNQCPLETNTMSSAEEFKAAGWMLWEYYSAKLVDYGGEYQLVVPPL